MSPQAPVEPRSPQLSWPMANVANNPIVSHSSGDACDFAMTVKVVILIYIYGRYIHSAYATPSARYQKGISQSFVCKQGLHFHFVYHFCCPGLLDGRSLSIRSAQIEVRGRFRTRR